MRRARPWLLCSGLFACAPEAVPADTDGSTTGSESTDTDAATDTDTETSTDAETSTGTEDLPAEPFCGDGNVDPGEVCDDANLADDDGCTISCEIGPCGFEWITRIPSTSDTFAMQRFDGSLEFLTQRINPPPRLTQLTHVAADGELGAIDDISDLIGNELPWEAARLPNGDLVIASTAAPLAHVRRFAPDNTLIWATEAPTDQIVRLAAGPGGQLAMMVDVAVADHDDDVRVLGLDANDGSIAWSHDLGGQVADNGYSLDIANYLVIDEAGRVYVGFAEYVDWQVNVPTVASFSSAGEPLWRKHVLKPTDEVTVISAITLGVDQTLYLTAQSYKGDYATHVLAIDPETGIAEWMFDYDDLANDRVYKTATGVAASGERVLVTGSWSHYENGYEIIEGYALAFDLDGTRVCLSELSTDGDWYPIAVAAGEQGEFYVGGRVSQPRDEFAYDMFAARIR